MSKDYGQGIFTMTDVNLVCAMTSLPNAKLIAYAAIDKSTATDANKTKARTMVGKCISPIRLGQAMCNFSLSHQGLKVIA